MFRCEVSRYIFTRCLYFDSPCTLVNTAQLVKICSVIIQQIVTMPIYGKEALNICHPYMTDILRYT